MEAQKELPAVPVACWCSWGGSAAGPSCAPSRCLGDKHPGELGVRLCRTFWSQLRTLSLGRCSHRAEDAAVEAGLALFLVVLKEVIPLCRVY